MNCTFCIFGDLSLSLARATTSAFAKLKRVLLQYIASTFTFRFSFLLLLLFPVVVVVIVVVVVVVVVFQPCFFVSKWHGAF